MRTRAVPVLPAAAAGMRKLSAHAPEAGNSACEALPSLMERARSLAQHPGYAFIEVYSTRLITVSASGQTAIIDI